MVQTDSRYFATYCRLDADSEDIHATVNGDAVSVGLEVTLKREEYVNERGKDVVRCAVYSPRDELMGFLPANFARRVADLMEAGWTARVCAAAVGFHEATRTFWVEAAVFAYEAEYADGLGAFTTGCMKRLAAGERPDIRLSDKLIDAALENKKFYKEVRNTTSPKQPKGDAYYKRKRTTTESLIVSGSEKKPGCIVGTVLFYVAVVAIIAAIVYFVFIR